MNLLEQYIVSVQSVEEYKVEWTKKFNKNFVKVNLTTDCYGRETTSEQVFSEEDWKNAQEKGYYMA